MRVDVWADVVCPWCYIGFVRLDKAIAEYQSQHPDDLEMTVYHHAYQLDTAAGPVPTSAVTQLGEKYGIPDEAVIEMMDRVSAIAATEDLHYRLPDTMHGNTRLAHRLLAAAATVGVGHLLLQRLFAAYFEAAESIFSATDLRPHALAVGMETELVDEVLNSDSFGDVVDYDIRTAEEIGVRGVPFFAFNQKIAISGAESVDVLVAAMSEAKTTN